MSERLVQLANELKAEKEKLLEELNKNLKKERTSVVRYHKKAAEAEERAKDITKEICNVDGHSWTPWLEYDGFLDREWYYKRYCYVCGIKDNNKKPPYVEYIHEESWEKLPEEKKKSLILEIKNTGMMKKEKR